MKADINFLDNPEVFRINQLPAHSDHAFYNNFQEWQTEVSSLLQSLNGTWKFRYSVISKWQDMIKSIISIPCIHTSGVGMRFILPTKAVGFRYKGLSGETYPDRMAGAVEGIYEVEGLPVTNYLVPQDCYVHMKTNWLEVYRNTTQDNSNRNTGVFGLKFSSVKKEFAFTCIPYTAEELENATHQEELPLPRRTVLSSIGAVRGVGGINSCGADVEHGYHIDAGKDIKYSFKISKI